MKEAMKKALLTIVKDKVVKEDRKKSDQGNLNPWVKPITAKVLLPLMISSSLRHMVKPKDGFLGVVSSIMDVC